MGIVHLHPWETQDQLGSMDGDRGLVSRNLNQAKHRNVPYNVCFLGLGSKATRSIKYTTDGLNSGTTISPL